jgi:hypothetical protein
MFSEIHEFYTKVVDELKIKDEAAAKALLQQVANDLRTGFKAQEAAIIKQIMSGSSAAQDAEHIAADVLGLAESVLQQILVAHGL